MMLLAAVLVLHPVLGEAGDLRLAATGVGEAEVAWTLDGAPVARTRDREAAVVPVPAGEHRVEARSEAATAWTAVARPDGAADGAAYVEAWSAAYVPTGHTASPGGSLPRLALPASLALAALLLAAAPGRSGLEALRRLRRR